MHFYLQGVLLIRSRQAPISMRIRSRQSGAKLTFFAWLSPTGGAANRQRLFLAHFHNCIMSLLLDWKLVNFDQGVQTPSCCLPGEKRFGSSYVVHVELRPLFRRTFRAESFRMGVS
jgi:hypothetical protein